LLFFLFLGLMLRILEIFLMFAFLTFFNILRSHFCLFFIQFCKTLSVNKRTFNGMMNEDLEMLMAKV